MKPLCHALGLSTEKVARLPELDPEDEALLTKAIEAKKGLAWKVIKRGFWTNGTPGLQSWLKEMTKWTVADCADQIACPTLITAADNDPAGAGAQTLHDALTCPKQLMHFSAADGADMHCEMMNRSLLNRRVFDWLDETLTG